jgi:hypothetical protein
VMRSPAVPEEGDLFPLRRAESEPARRDPGVATAFAARNVALDRGIAARPTCAGGELCLTTARGWEPRHIPFPVRWNGPLELYEDFTQE